MSAILSIWLFCVLIFVTTRIVVVIVVLGS